MLFGHVVKESRDGRDHGMDAMCSLLLFYNAWHQGTWQRKINKPLSVKAVPCKNIIYKNVSEGTKSQHETGHKMEI